MLFGKAFQSTFSEQSKNNTLNMIFQAQQYSTIYFKPTISGSRSC